VLLLARRLRAAASEFEGLASTRKALATVPDRRFVNTSASGSSESCAEQAVDR
jgi:hypothetical protein